MHSDVYIFFPLYEFIRFPGRLSATGNALSDAVNVRSDVMTKMKAFFDKKPELD